MYFTYIHERPRGKILTTDNVFVVGATTRHGDGGAVYHEGWRPSSTSLPLPPAVAAVVHDLLEMDAINTEKM